MSKVFPRLLGVLGVFVVMGSLFWAAVNFGLATQDGLAPALVARLDGDPARIQAYLDEMAATALLAGLGGLLLGAILACAWLLLIEQSPPYGDKSARAKRGSWAALMLVAVVGAGLLFWFKLISAPIAATLAPSVPLNASIAGMLLLVFGYWLSTGIFAPASTKIAVPGGTIFAR